MLETSQSISKDEQVGKDIADGDIGELIRYASKDIRRQIQITGWTAGVALSFLYIIKPLAERCKAAEAEIARLRAALAARTAEPPDHNAEYEREDAKP